MMAALGRVLTPMRAGPDRSRLADGQYDAPAVLHITSSAFIDGGAMPTEHAGRGIGDNTSPPLQWDGVPQHAKQLVLIIEDIDVPLPRPLIHTIALFDPSRNALAEGALRPDAPDIRFVPALGHRGYVGPGPIPGHGPHNYRFHLLALDITVPDSVRNFRSLRNGIAGHVCARGLLTGTYSR